MDEKKKLERNCAFALLHSDLVIIEEDEEG